MKKYLFLFVTVVSLALFSGRAPRPAVPARDEGRGIARRICERLKVPLELLYRICRFRIHPKANRWVIGAEYLMKNYGYRNASVPRVQFTAEGGYYLKFLSDPTKMVFLSVGGSALAGYETVNWGDRMLYDGSTLLAKDAFVYGGAITLELEAYLTDRIVLLAGIRERVLWGSSLDLFTTQFGLGVKFIIH